MRNTIPAGVSNTGRVFFALTVLGICLIAVSPPAQACIGYGCNVVNQLQSNAPRTAVPSGAAAPQIAPIYQQEQRIEALLQQRQAALAHGAPAAVSPARAPAPIMNPANIPTELNIQRNGDGSTTWADGLTLKSQGGVNTAQGGTVEEAGQRLCSIGNPTACPGGVLEFQQGGKSCISVGLGRKFCQ